MNGKNGIIALLLTMIPTLVLAASPVINIVAAENFYGDLAQQLGGEHVRVSSILSNPDQDPHMFEASVSTAKALSEANLVVFNGINYDPWMEKLLAASKSDKRKIIVAAQLLHRKLGDNPHLWYDPMTMPAVAHAITDQLDLIDPVNKSDYDKRLQLVLASFKPLNEKIQYLRSKYEGIPVAATEPVFGYMADALGMKMRNEKFQLAVMNDTEPSARDISIFEYDLKTHQVKVMFYNSQASDESAKRVQKVALIAHVPVVGVSETEPAGLHYQQWMLGQLNALERALESK